MCVALRPGLGREASGRVELRAALGMVAERTVLAWLPALGRVDRALGVERTVPVPERPVGPFARRHVDVHRHAELGDHRGELRVVAALVAEPRAVDALHPRHGAVETAAVESEPLHLLVVRDALVEPLHGLLVVRRGLARELDLSVPLRGREVAGLAVQQQGTVIGDGDLPALGEELLLRNRIEGRNGILREDRYCHHQANHWMPLL